MMRKVWSFAGGFVLVASVVAVGAAQTEPPDTPPPASQPSIENMTTPELIAVAENALQSNAIQQGVQILDYVLRRDPTNVEAMLIIANLGEAAGDWDTARNYYLRARAVEEHNFEANLGLGKFFALQKMWRQSVFYLETAAEVAPENRLAEVRAYLAAAYRGQGQYTKGLEIAQLAVNANPSSFEARQALVGLLTEMGRYDEALGESETLVELARRLAQENPGSRPALQRLNSAYDDRANAVSRYLTTLFEVDARGQAIDRPRPGKEPEIASLTSQLVDVFKAQAGINQMLTMFDMLPFAERAVQYDQTNIKYVLDLAQLYHNTGQIMKAATTYQRVYALDANNETAIRALRQIGAPLTPTSQPAAAASDSEAGDQP